MSMMNLSRFCTSFELVLVGILSTSSMGCGAMELEIKLSNSLPSTLPNSPVNPGALPPYSLKTLSLDSSFGRNTFVGLPKTDQNQFALENNQDMTVIDPTYGLRIFDANGVLKRHVPIPSTYYEITKVPVFTTDSTGTTYIGSSWDSRNNGEEKRILKISSSGVITVLTGAPGAVDGYNRLTIIRNASNIEELHTTYTHYDINTGTGIYTEVQVLSTSGAYVRSYASEASYPSSILEAASKDIYIMPFATSYIQRYNASGVFQETITLSSYYDTYNFPRLISNGLLVALHHEDATSTYYLERIDLSTNPITIVSRFSINDEILFRRPTDIATSPDGQYFDATFGDYGDRRRLRFHFNGTNYEYQKTLTSAGSGNLHFSLHLSDSHTVNHSIESGSDGSLYLMDHSNARIQVTNSAGAYLRQFSISTTAIDHSALDSYMSIAMTSANKLLVIGTEVSPSTQSLVRRYNPANGNLEASFQVPAGKFIGFDKDENIWMQTSTNLLQLSAVGVTLKTISISDTTTFFGEASLVYFQVVDSHIYSISGVNLGIYKTDFNGTTEALVPAADLTLANCMALLPYSLQQTPDGDLIILSMDADNYSNSSFIVVNKEHGRIVQRLEGINAREFVSYIARPEGIWAYISDNRLALYK